MDSVINAKKTSKASKDLTIMDSNEAAALVAYKANEVCVIDPQYPSSLGEWAEEWATKGVKNIFGKVPEIVKSDVEPKALSTTLTSSRGLLMKVPYMYKVAGELTPTVIHVAAKATSTYASSILGDHADVMAARTTGFAILFGNNAQEAMDLALISQAATLKAKVPFINVFDNATSSELAEVSVIPDAVIEAMLDKNEVTNARVSPEGVTNDFVQAHLTSNLKYINAPKIVKETMEQFASLTGRKYDLYEYYGHPRPARLIVITGSDASVVKQAVDKLNKQDETVGVLIIRLFRPFVIADFINSIPKSVTDIAVLDRCKLSNGIGEPLYMNALNAFNEYQDNYCPTVLSGRYGLTSKNLTETMVVAVFEELKKKHPKKHFTLGIEDDEKCLSRLYDEHL